ncbi:hypothetical protein RCL1_004991 [Eukaryota sp. TZLM3-RCL]
MPSCIRKLSLKIRCFFEPVFLTIVVCFLFFVTILSGTTVKVHLHHAKYAYVFSGTIAVYFGIMAITHLALTLWRSRETIQLLTNTHRKDLECLKDTEEYKKYFHSCEKCFSLRFFRCHHCSLCRRCVAGYDHHCPVIWCCVGFSNRRNFFLFLFFALFGGLFSSISHAPIVLSLFKHAFMFKVSYHARFLLISGILSLATCLALIPLTFSHFLYALRNTNTYESFVLKNLKKQFPHVIDPFCSKTKAQNWREFHGLSDPNKTVVPILWWLVNPLRRQTNFGKEMNEVFYKVLELEQARSEKKNNVRDVNICN